MDQLFPFKCFRNRRKRPEWCASHNKKHLMEEVFRYNSQKKKKKKVLQENSRPGACSPAYEDTLVHSHRKDSVFPLGCLEHSLLSIYTFACGWAIKFHLQSSMLEKQLSHKVTRKEMSRKQQAAEKSVPLSVCFQWKHLTRPDQFVLSDLLRGLGPPELLKHTGQVAIFLGFQGRG